MRSGLFLLLVKAALQRAQPRSSLWSCVTGSMAGNGGLTSSLILLVSRLENAICSDMFEKAKIKLLWAKFECDKINSKYA